MKLLDGAARNSVAHVAGEKARKGAGITSPVRHQLELGQAERKKKGKRLGIKARGHAAMVQPWRGDRMVWHNNVRPPAVPTRASKRERERARERERLVRSGAPCCRMVGPGGAPARELRGG